MKPRVRLTHRLLEQRLFASEVTVEKGLADLREVGDLAQTRAVVSLATEEFSSTANYRAARFAPGWRWTVALTSPVEQTRTSTLPRCRSQ